MKRRQNGAFFMRLGLQPGRVTPLGPPANANVRVCEQVAICVLMEEIRAAQTDCLDQRRFLLVFFVWCWSLFIFPPKRRPHLIFFSLAFVFVFLRGLFFWLVVGLPFIFFYFCFYMFSAVSSDIA